MSGFFRTEADDWEEASETFSQPWTAALCRIDLRFLANSGSTITRRKMMARWGWSERRTRNLLRSTWRDPFKLNTCSGPKKVPKRSQKGPTPDRAKLDYHEEEVPRRSQEGPKKVHTRVVEQEQEQKQKNAGAREAEIRQQYGLEDSPDYIFELTRLLEQEANDGQDL